MLAMTLSAGLLNAATDMWTLAKTASVQTDRQAARFARIASSRAMQTALLKGLEKQSASAIQAGTELLVMAFAATGRAITRRAVAVPISLGTILSVRQVPCAKEG